MRVLAKSSLSASCLALAVLWSSLRVTPAQAVDPDVNVTATIRQNNQGAGYGLNALFGTVLSIRVTLTAQSGFSFHGAPTIRDNGGAFWSNPVLSLGNSTAISNGLMGRDDDHSVAFYGKFKKNGLILHPGALGTDSLFDAAVADVLILDHPREAQTDAATFTIPTGGTGIMHLNVKLRAPTSAPDTAGTLKLTWSGLGAAGITSLVCRTSTFSDPNTGVPNGGVPLGVPRAGFANEPITINTDANFTSAATIKAEFTWDSSMQKVASSFKSTDVLNVDKSPSSYSLDVLDVQAFGATTSSNQPALLRSPNSEVTDRTWDRTGVFADGTSVLVLRIPGPCAEAFTFSVKHMANTSTYPDATQTKQYVGTLHVADVTDTAPPTYGLPSLPATDDNIDGVTSLDVGADVAKVVYYRPPNNFLFGRQGQQQLKIEVKTTAAPNTVVAYRFINLVRPTIILNHGFNSGPESMFSMQDTFVSRSQGERQIRVVRLNWSDICHSGYDTVPARLYASAANTLAGIIADELKYNWGAGVAATRVDFVGHSMGGVIVKWYASDLDNRTDARRNGFPNLSWNITNGTVSSKSHRADNFNVGDIRRVVTFGSPLRGSPIADTTSALGYNTVKGLNKKSAADDGCCWDDLSTGGTATKDILRLRHPNVSWLPIVCTAQGLNWTNLLGNSNQAASPFTPVLKACSVITSIIDDVVLGIWPWNNTLGPDNSDFCVNKYSQMDCTNDADRPAKVQYVTGIVHTEEPSNGWDTLGASTVCRYVADALDIQEPGIHTAGYGMFNSGF